MPSIIGWIKNGRKGKNLAYMPASYPSSKVSYGSGTAEDALDELISDVKGAAYTDRSSLLDMTYIGDGLLYDIQLGKIHILSLELEIKANANTGGFVTLASLPYNIVLQTAIAFSTWQSNPQFMGVVRSNGVILIAGSNDKSTSMSYKGSCVVIESA